jgi:hypothetical protein
LAGLVAIAGISQGCIFIDDDDDDGYYYYTDDDGTVDPPIDEEIFTVGIDEGATLQADPGEGVGLFVEYAAGGKWRVWTTCDTNYSKVVCLFDAFVAVDIESQLTDVAEDELEGADFTERLDQGMIRIHAETGTDADAVTFTTPEGAVLALEMYLDDVSQPQFVYWFGDGVLHTGAPTNPVEFEPTTP